MNSFQKAKKYIESRGGKMISSSAKYNENFAWICQNNHENFSSRQIVRRKSWCKKCIVQNTRNRAIEKLNENKSTLISFDGIKCIFVCEKGHKQTMTTSHVIEGNKCGICHKEKIKKGFHKLSIKEIKNRIKIYGFEFIDKEYKSLNFEHLIKCKNNHITKRKLKHLINGIVGCYECNNFFRSEKNFREIVEKHFNKPFPKCRPEWLINPETGYKLELDCYNESLKLAFEYDGQFHFEVRKGLNNDLEKTKKLDLIKKNLCEKNGIKLIRIPYFMKKNQIEEIILKEVNSF